MYNNSNSLRSGFTLIEMIVSLALFSVVVTTAVGALLVLISSNKQLQNEQSTLSNLSFALDSMTREIRTGSHYYCNSGPLSTSGETDQKLFSSDPEYLDDRFSRDDLYRSCSQGRSSAHRYHGISFDEGGRSITDGATSRRVVYFYDQDEGKIYRRLSGSTPESIVSDGIFISNAEFFVTGAYPLLGSGFTDTSQPKITIFLEAHASEEEFIQDRDDGSGAFELSHKIQTTVTQRSLDI